MFVSVVPLHALFFPKLKMRKVKTTESILRHFFTALICQLPDFTLKLKCLTPRPVHCTGYTNISAESLWVLGGLPYCIVELGNIKQIRLSGGWISLVALFTRFH